MSRPKTRILAGVDFSRESRRALAAARSLAESLGGNVTVAHVRPLSDVKAAVIEERGDLLRASPGHLAAGLEQHYAHRLERLTRRHPGEQAVLLRGAAARALCREARKGYSLLVLGDRGRGRVASTILGSTVRQALSWSRIPVLVVRRSGRRSTSRTRSPS